MFDLTAPRQLAVGYDSGDVLLFRVATHLTRQVRVSFLHGNGDRVEIK